MKTRTGESRVRVKQRTFEKKSLIPARSRPCAHRERERENGDAEELLFVGQRERERDRETERDRDRDRQTDRQTDRQRERDRQTDRQRERERREGRRGGGAYTQTSN